MAYTIKQRMISGAEAAGGYNYLLVEIDAAADLLAMPSAQDGSVAYIKDDDETLYVLISSTWTKLDKSAITEGQVLRIDGIDPHTLMAVNKLFPRRAEFSAEHILTTATLPDTEAGLYEGLSIYDKTADVPLWCKTPGEQEDDTVTVTQGAITKSGNVTITLNGVAVTVAVVKDDSAAIVAGKIRLTTFTGWTTGGTGATITFKKDAVGACSAPTAVDTGGTGVTFGTFTRTNEGVDTVWVSPADDTITDTGSKFTATTIDGALDEIGAYDVLTERGDMIYRNATVPARLDLGASGTFLKASATDPTWAAITGADVGLADAGGYFTTDTAEAALQQVGATLLGFKGTASAVPASGTYEVNDKLFNSEPASAEFIGWVCTVKGTMGTLNGNATTGDILTGTAALTPSSLTGLAVGQYIAIATVTGALKITSLPATLAATTVDVESAASQKVLSVTSTTGFVTGQTICVGFSANCEVCVIASVQAGVSLTTVDNLTKTHAVSETVTNCVVLDGNADATADDQAVSFSAATWKGFGLIE
jgi:hypothetical protein